MVKGASDMLGSPAMVTAVSIEGPSMGCGGLIGRPPPGRLV